MAGRRATRHAGGPARTHASATPRRRVAAAPKAGSTPAPQTPRGRATPGSGEPPRIGILSLQGDFALHAAALRELGCTPVRVSLPEHLEPSLAALVLPGGESTTMLRLLASTGLRAPLESFVRERPVLGTCAGLILLAREADKLPAPTLGALDVTAARNAWGRQVHSFTGEVEAPALGGTLAGVFIRAPRITRVGPGVQVLARFRGEPVGVRQGHVVALAFHPELTNDRRAHAWFVNEVVQAGKRAAS